MPAEYVNKLARMFQDIKVSEDLNTEFKDKNKGSDTAGMICHMIITLFAVVSLADLVNIKVLNAGAWSRSSERVPVSLPTEVFVVYISCYINLHYHMTLYSLSQDIVFVIT